MSKNLRKESRVDKKIAAKTETHETAIVSNISKKGGFITINEKQNGPFNLNLLVNNYKSVNLKCVPKWSDENGVGFEIISVEKNKEAYFNDFIDRQLQYSSDFGADRIFRTELFITLGETNATGNVYFSNFVKFQGVVRERLLIKHVPDIGKIMLETGIRLVTIDTYHKYKENAYFGDIAIGELTVKEIKGAEVKVVIRFKRKSDGALFGEGYQRFCCVNAAGKVIKLPELFNFIEFYSEI